jgi:hypothetical protein
MDKEDKQPMILRMRSPRMRLRRILSDNPIIHAERGEWF